MLCTPISLSDSRPNPSLCCSWASFFLWSSGALDTAFKLSIRHYLFSLLRIYAFGLGGDSELSLLLEQTQGAPGQCPAPQTHHPVQRLPGALGRVAESRPPPSFSDWSPSFPSSHVSDVAKNKDWRGRRQEAPAFVTLLLPFKLLSWLGPFASLCLQLRGDGLLQLWLQQCPPPPPASHRACSRCFPSPADRRWPSRHPKGAPCSLLSLPHGGPARAIHKQSKGWETPGELLCKGAAAATHLDSRRQLQGL